MLRFIAALIAEDHVLPEPNANTTAREALLGDLLERWEEMRDRGRAISVGELCVDSPELADELQRRIHMLEALEPALRAEPATARAGQTEDGSLWPPSAGERRFLPTIPGYEVLSVLGRGGMGVVYKARQLGLNRLVALKMIRAGVNAHGLELQRFRTEALAVAQLQHPNIVQIYDVGELDGQPYFSLEYVNGGSLGDRVIGEPLSPNEAARLVETLGRAVEHAHRHGILHRDLKPDNVLLQVSPGVSRPAPAKGKRRGSGIEVLQQTIPKIADFGLAKRLDGPAGPTLSGEAMGTPSYMAPEQVDGRRGTIGPGVDIYALGSILYELLTGKPPFESAEPMDTLLQVTREEPVPPTRLNPKVPRDLETICLKCLEKKAPNRYLTAAALADDLGHYLRGEPIAARPLGTVGWLVKWVRRQPALAALLAVMLGTAMALALIAATGFWSTRQLIADRDWVAHTYEVLKKTDRVTGLVTDAETGQRGYLLTGDKRYLEPYEEAIDQIAPTLDRLEELTRDEPDQGPRLQALRGHIDDKLAEMKETLWLRKQPQGFEAAVQLVKTNRGRHSMDAARTLIHQIESEESRLLARRNAEAAVSTRTTRTILTAGLALALLLVGAPLVGLAVYFIRRKKQGR